MRVFAGIVSKTKNKLTSVDNLKNHVHPETTEIKRRSVCMTAVESSWNLRGYSSKDRIIIAHEQYFRQAKSIGSLHAREDKEKKGLLIAFYLNKTQFNTVCLYVSLFVCLFVWGGLKP